MTRISYKIQIMTTVPCQYTSSSTTNDGSSLFSFELPRCGDTGGEVAYLVVLLILTVTGNIFMIIISLKDTNLKGGMFPMIVLAIGEVIYVIITIVTIFAVLGSSVVIYVIRTNNICPWLGTVNLILVQFDLASHGLLGVIRYLAICRPIKYRLYVNVRNSCLMMVGNMVYAIIMGVIPTAIQFENAPLLNYTLDPSALNCMMKLGRMASSYICVYFGPPMILAGISYLLVFYKLRLCCAIRKNETAATALNVTKNQKRLAVTLGCSFLVVLLHSTFYPISIIFFVGQEHICFLSRRHFTWLIMHNSLVNPVAFLSMYAYKRRYFRVGKASSSVTSVNNTTRTSKIRSEVGPIR